MMARQGMKQCGYFPGHVCTSTRGCEWPVVPLLAATEVAPQVKCLYAQPAPGHTIPKVHISDVIAWLFCRPKWDFSSPLRQNLTPKEPNKHLWLGSVIHYALAAYYGTPLEGTTRPKSYLVDAFDSEALRTLRVLKGILGEIPEDLMEYAALGHGMMNHYGLWAPNYDTFDVLMPEVKLHVAMDGWDFKGQTDGLIKDDEGRLWLLEHKTSSRIPPLDAVSRAWQGMAYVWAARADPEIRAIGHVVGIMYNFLYKYVPVAPKLVYGGTQLSRRANHRITPEMYLEYARIEGFDPEDYLDFVVKLKQDVFFRRYHLRPSQAKLELFEKNLKAAVHDMLNDPAIYPQDSLYQCRGCPFQPLCSLQCDGLDLAGAIQDQYKLNRARTDESPDVE